MKTQFSYTLEEIPFIDDEHKANFIQMVERWKLGQTSMEYQSACYIAAIPMIFKKIESHIPEFESPISWIYDYLQTDFENDEEALFDLTGSMIQLGKLSLNLWNGYKDFSLMECIGNLDRKHHNAVLAAINIRAGIYR